MAFTRFSPIQVARFDYGIHEQFLQLMGQDVLLITALGESLSSLSGGNPAIGNGAAVDLQTGYDITSVLQCVLQVRKIQETKRHRGKRRDYYTSTETITQAVVQRATVC
ncbi:hypothetical protein P3T76_007124 [Phytophthora citrophthora]|uniref:Uncharacterized protein n=1 Tax=Phytophthora citrophthora TaxID=4793 RepID=A0AAD9LLF5_9STRA|nr:hypothetical protein P3T76_007124 [Phytophthora citrophthora]